MSVAQDMAAMYRRPAAVLARRMSGPMQESGPLIWLMLACTLMFVGQLPWFSRLSYLGQGDFDMMMGGALIAWIFIAPLLFYVLALLSHWVMRALGGQGGGWHARVALFWSLLAAAPLSMLYGLVGAFLGDGTSRDMIGLLWPAAFLLFWGLGLRAAFGAKGTA